MPASLSHLLAFTAGAFLGGAIVYSYNQAYTPHPPPKVPVTDRDTWSQVLKNRHIAAWAAAITVDDNVSADILATIGRQEFGEERWAIDVHRYREELW